MQTKHLLVASVIIPLLLISCNREDQGSPLASGTSEEKQAVAPADPAKVMEDSPPAAGMAPAPVAPPAEPDPAMANPATPPSEPAKSGY
jgi:hypothetical protein